MANALAETDDVAAALLRPLTDMENSYIGILLNQASALLRNAAPSVDGRMSQYASDPTAANGLNPTVVAAVVAGIIKRYLVNPKGLTATTDGTGPYSHGETYALRTEKDARGVMQVTEEDLATLFPNRKRLRAGMIRTRPGLAPRPVGRYGGVPTPAQAFAAVVTYTTDLTEVFPDGEAPLGPVA